MNANACSPNRGARPSSGAATSKIARFLERPPPILSSLSSLLNLGNTPSSPARMQTNRMPSRNLQPRSNVRAFTLIELVIAASLASLILVAGYMCLSSATATQKLIEPRAEVIQNARVAMNILAADLRSACPLSSDYQFLGMHRMIGDVEADNLDFATHNYAPSRPNEGDFSEESFFVQQESETGRFSLWRRRNPTIAPDPLAGGALEEIADGLRGVRFEYYDGDDWYDDWGEIKPQRKQTDRDTSELEPNLEGMPEAVRITLWFDPNPRAKKTNNLAAEETKSEPPLVFQSVARLNLAAISQQNSSQNNAGAAGANQNGQPQQPGMPNGPN
jgi:prepilin-type N-terminal cleavage/methylation domain-containing protein